MKNYKHLISFTALLILLTAILQIFFPELIRWYTWVTLGYLSLISLFTIFLVSKAIGEDAQGFYNFFMASTAVRLFLSALVLFVYYYNFKENRIHFTFTFFLLYFLFVAFEIKTLLSKLHTKSDKPNNHDEKHTS